jgi:hypothetical protein
LGRPSGRSSPELEQRIGEEQDDRGLPVNGDAPGTCPSTEEIARLEAELEGNQGEIDTIQHFENANRRMMHNKEQQIELLRENTNETVDECTTKR